MFSMLIRRLSNHPPHTWGPRTYRAGLKAHGRITPTCVGKAKCKQPDKAVCWDHPHIRGDHRHNPLPIASRWGSPPHTWGPHGLLVQCGNACRITPHIRGDHHHLKSGLYACIGSLPHTWGPPWHGVKTMPMMRITPTYMGTTLGTADHNQRI